MQIAFHHKIVQLCYILIGWWDIRGAEKRLHSFKKTGFNNSPFTPESRIPFPQELSMFESFSVREDWKPFSFSLTEETMPVSQPLTVFKTE